MATECCSFEPSTLIKKGGFCKTHRYHVSNGEFCPESATKFPLVPEKKDTNPKDSVGTRKVPFLSVLPLRVIAEVSLAMLEGARKYGRHNYRPAGVRASVYMDAIGRHLGAWYEGEDIDAESGLSHVTKAIACLMVLRDSMMHGNWVDDRPPAVESGWVAEFNHKAAEIIDRYPEAVDPWTQKRVEEEAQ